MYFYFSFFHKLNTPSARKGKSRKFKYSCQNDKVGEVKIEGVSADKGYWGVPLAVEFWEQRATFWVEERSKKYACKEEGGIWDYAEQIAGGDFILLIKRQMIAIDVFWGKEYSKHSVRARGRSVQEIQAQNDNDY